MSVIVLTVSESDVEYISGVPAYIEFDTDIPATVFYTFDGTEPTESSDIAIGQVYLPTHGSAFTVKAFALAGDSYSSTLELEYYTSQSNIDRDRILDNEGIVVLDENDTYEDFLGYDADGQPSRASDISFEDLELRASTTDRIGQPIDGGTSLPFINFGTFCATALEPMQGRSSSPNNNNVNFDPKAGLIIIDGFDQDDFNDQIVKIFNRPHGTVELSADKYSDLSHSDAPITANLSRIMYNPKTGKIIFYYYESREARWVQSIQSYEPLSMNLTQIKNNKFVFQWIQDRGMSKIY